ncbi:MAG: S-layer family protein [Coleofasciculaceae cyanobacterium SM2_3_26]|nr:S-layer family protein [Coleofasciculaceae cyanobacterium SM2_3_26]
MIRTGTIPLGGRGGDVAIAADLLEVRGISADGVFTTDITASTFSSAPAGNLNVTVGRLILQDGGTLSTSSLGSGQGGSLTVRAEDSVEVIGISPDGRFPSALFATSGNSRQQATGNGGDLTVITDTFHLQEGGTASVRSFGAGNAGNLSIQVEVLQLEQGATIDGTTVAGRGGSIHINAQQVTLRQGSRIATDAGSTDGGNIAIATDTLVALDNSDITANALEGTGGRVFVEAAGIFGTQFRDRTTPKSDITATSSLGAEFDGVVAITTPEVEVQSLLNELTAEFLTTEAIIADSCLSHANDPQGSLTVTGTGGLPTNPYRPSGTRYPIASIQTLEARRDLIGGRSPQEADMQATDTKESPRSWQLGDPIQEARSIMATPDGRLLLGTAPPQALVLRQAKDLICHRAG